VIIPDILFLIIIYLHSFPKTVELETNSIKIGRSNFHSKSPVISGPATPLLQTTREKERSSLASFSFP
jgi:hypothetical protein